MKTLAWLIFSAGALAGEQVPRTWNGEAIESLQLPPFDFDLAGTAENFQDPSFYETVGIPVAKDGTVPFVMSLSDQSATLARDEGVSTGTRVRITAPAPNPVPGHIVASDDDTLTVSFRDSSRDTFTKKGRTLTGSVASVSDDALLVLTSEGQPPVRVPRKALVKLEVSEERSRKGRGALIGAGVGLGAALALAAIASSDDDDVDIITGPEFAVGLSLLFVPAGAAVGAIAAPGERWAPVKFNDGGRGISVPRIGAAFSIRF